MPTKSFFKKNTVLMLKSFIYTAERKSLTEAGKILLLPVSSISRYITDLEKDMQKKLINTLKGKIFLTPEGEKLYRRANKLIKSWDSILSDVEVEKSVIRIASFPSAMNNIMPDLFEKITFLMPNITIDIQMLSTEEFNEKLKNDEIDMGIYAYYKDTDKDKEPDFMYKKIGQYSPKLIISKEHHFNKDKVENSELSFTEVLQNKDLEDLYFMSGPMFKNFKDIRRKICYSGIDLARRLTLKNKAFTVLDIESVPQEDRHKLCFYNLSEAKNMGIFVCTKEQNEFLQKIIKLITISKSSQ